MKKPNKIEWLENLIKRAERKLREAEEKLNKRQQNLFLLKAERDQQKESKNVNKL